MTLRKLAAKIKPRTAPKPAAASPDVTAEVERLKRQAEAQTKAAAKAAQEAETERKRAAEALAEANRVRIESALVGAASKGRALNPAQVARLLGSDVEIRDGKLVQKGGDKSVDDFVAEWLKSDDGKHHVAASVPGGGSGGPSNPNPPPIAKKHDLATNEGMTAYVREREATAKRPPPPGTAPRTPQQ